MSDTPDDPLPHLEIAMAVTRKISNQVDILLKPLAEQMRILNWPPEYQAIMWEAVMIEAKQRMEEIQP